MSVVIRVVKLGQRFGDGAEVAVLELVDYNTGQTPKAAAKEKAKDEKKGRKKKKPMKRQKRK